MAHARVPRDPPEGAQPEPAPRVSVSSVADEVSYENVTPAQHRQLSSQQQRQDSESSQKPYTVYSILQAPNPTGSVDATPEPVPSQSVGQSEAEREVDTVYSVLQKPKKTCHEASGIRL